MISCVLVLLCLIRSDGPYRLQITEAENEPLLPDCRSFRSGFLRASRARLSIFPMRCSSASVNSFGSIAMAGYTAANNVLGFLYVSVNSVTQACMSFTSQNYGAGKPKRMDGVLLDCMILTVAVGVTLGGGAYLFGNELLKIYTGEADVIACGLEDFVDHDGVVFSVWADGISFRGHCVGMGHSGVPMILSIIGTVGTRIVWIYWIFPYHRSLMVLFISYPALDDHLDHFAGDMLRVGTPEGAWKYCVNAE